jgi:drug/metabolite transporter (DMT)-like permease
MFLTNYSLTVISYPTQALAKSCKILPAMIGSLFVKGMKYHPLQYLSVVMITAGVVAFNYNNKKGETSDSWLGMIALLMSLMLDGLTSYFTETLKRVYNSTSLSAQQICSGFGALLTFPLVILKNFIFTDVTVLEYILKFPDVVPDILVFASFSAFGNYFIFWGLNLFGSLNLVIITTIRKFLTVLVSILYFRHSIDWIQALCIVFVVLGTALDVYVGHARDHKDVSHAGEQKDDKKKQEKVD